MLNIQLTAHKGVANLKLEKTEQASYRPSRLRKCMCPSCGLLTGFPPSMNRAFRAGRQHPSHDIQRNGVITSTTRTCSNYCMQPKHSIDRSWLWPPNNPGISCVGHNQG